MSEPTPFPTHLGSEFLLWLWCIADTESHMNVSGLGVIDLWVEDRIAFRPSGGSTATVLVTAENSAQDTAAFAALYAGKRVQQIRLGLRRDEREFTFTLDENLHVRALKLPSILSEGAEEAVLDRMHLIDEVQTVIVQLFVKFAALRRDLPLFKERVGSWLSAAQ